MPDDAQTKLSPLPKHDFANRTATTSLSAASSPTQPRHTRAPSTCWNQIRKPGFLVSVRSVHEATLALQTGVDLIDVKEPSRGSLGQPDINVVAGIARCVQSQRTLSMAWGELREAPLDTLLTELRTSDWAVHLALVKLGLSGMRSTHWHHALARVAAQLPAHVRLVAVAYADWLKADAPAPQDVLQFASELALDAVLLDTFDKSAGDLFAHLPITAVAQWIDHVQAAGHKCVVAGSLRAESLVSVLQHGADLVAVRGAACSGNRSGALDAARLFDLKRIVVGAQAPLSSSSG